MKNVFNSFLSNDDGTTAIEFALIAMSFLTLVFGVFESGRLILTQNALQYSLENATRYALVNDDVTEDDLREYIAEDMTALTLDPARIDVEIDFDEFSGIDFINVSGTYDFSPIVLAFLPESWADITLTANSRMPVQECSSENCPWADETEDDDEDAAPPSDGGDEDEGTDEDDTDDGSGDEDGGEEDDGNNGNGNGGGNSGGNGNSGGGSGNGNGNGNGH
jgi:Flp pilus assembly protein TadG